MEEKLFNIIEDDSSEPYALIVKINDKCSLSNLNVVARLTFKKALRTNLIEFVREQCKEFNGNENSVYISEDSFLWLCIEDIKLHKYLLEKLQTINRIELVDSALTKNDLKAEIKNKFNYFLLDEELTNTNSPTKKNKI